MSAGKLCEKNFEKTEKKACVNFSALQAMGAGRFDISTGRKECEYV